jgi:hypothetical protein
MPWWTPPDVDPNWRPPRLNRPGHDRLRDRLTEILGDRQGEEWFGALRERLSANAIDRFLKDGAALTSEETRTIVGFVGEFGFDMRTNKLIRRNGVAAEAPQAASGVARFWPWR